MTTLTPSCVSDYSSPSDPHGKWALDGTAPDFVATATCTAEAVDVVRWAADQRVALVPVGGGLSLAEANPLRAEQWAAMTSSAMNGVVAYSPDDQVVTVQPGITLASLQTELARAGQYLPLDPPYRDRATLGGIVATDAQGLWRPHFGTPRDRVLHVEIATGEAKLVRGGAKVVKNVAGYDLCKLFVKSWGSLGFITEVTFKTQPVPEVRRHMRFAAASVLEAVTAGLALQAERLDPLYAVAVGGERASLYVGLAGSAEPVSWQECEIERVVVAAGLARADGALSENDLRECIAAAPEPLVARVTVRPTYLPNLVERLSSQAVRPVIQVPTGAADLAFDVADLDRQAVLRLARAVAEAVPAGGYLTWPKLPATVKGDIDAFGPTRADFPLMRGIKETMDPRGIFSPGRFLGRL